MENSTETKKRKKAVHRKSLFYIYVGTKGFLAPNANFTSNIDEAMKFDTRAKAVSVAKRFGGFCNDQITVLGTLV